MDDPTSRPRAADVLVEVVTVSSELPVDQALVMESLAYSMLLAGPEFQAWRAERPRREIPVPDEPVRIARDGATLRITLDVPSRRNSFNRWMRDGLIDALEIAELDDTVTRVDLDGAGPAFCSGGDLDEFGTASDVVAAHRIRLQRSAGLRIHRLRERIHPLLHGACVGAGIEVPAFAAHVRARRDAWFQLPEVRMGLIPGAGGTVSVPRRIGVERTLDWAISGERIDAVTALEWGLIDELVE